MWLYLRRSPLLGLRKRILNSPCLLILLIHTKHKTIRWCLGLSPCLHSLERELIHLVHKTKNMWVLIGQLPQKAGSWDAPLALRDFNLSNKHYGNVMNYLWTGGLRSKWCCGHKEGRYIATHQGEKFQPDYSRPQTRLSATRHHHPTTIKTLQTSKIIRLFVSLQLVFNRRLTLSELKSRIVFSELRSRTVGIENWCATHYVAEAQRQWYIKTLYT